MIIHRYPAVGAAPKGGEGKYAVYFYDRTSPFNCVPLAIVDGFHHVATAADAIPRLQAEAVLAAAAAVRPKPLSEHPGADTTHHDPACAKQKQVEGEGPGAL